MDGPLKGIKVLEVATYVAVPAAGALMADMGAEVTKVESPEGDTWRNFHRSRELKYDSPAGHPFQMDNRGKRSVVIDLWQPGAIDVVLKLVDGADVFLTNFRPDQMERYHLRYEDLGPRNPRMIYLAFNGYGMEGPERNRPAFDHTAFWARSGIMSLFTHPAQSPVDLQIAMGDHSAAPLLLSGVLAALWERERTGKGQKITSCLFNMGMWVVGADVQEALVARRAPRRYDRFEMPDPLYNTYRSKDGKWLIMVMRNSDLSWFRLCEALGLQPLFTDPQYDTPEGRFENSAELVPVLDEAFASMTLEELAPRLDANHIIWEPAQSLVEALDDPQAQANGFFTTLEHPKYGAYETLDTPLRFSESEVRARGPAPEIGQHTNEVLAGLGYTTQDLASLREAGIIL